jgi:hypothetical protein
MRALCLAAVALSLSACAAAGRPAQGRPSGREGWLVYGLRALRFEAPAAWRASGDERRIALEAPGGGARLELSVPEVPFADERACLAAAEGKLAERQKTLARARRHPTRFGGLSAQALEGDEGGWHVWAVAACQGGTQYRVFFTATTPATAEAIDAWRTLLESARVGDAAA